MLSLINNIGAYIVAAFCGAVHATAGGTGDATAVTGKDIDRTGALSGKLVLAFTATLADTKTLTLAVALQESADGITWDTAEALQAATLAATGSTGGTTEFGTVTFDVALFGRKKHIRFNFTPELNATATDTAVVTAVFVANGDSIPASALTVTAS